MIRNFDIDEFDIVFKNKTITKSPMGLSLILDVDIVINGFLMHTRIDISEETMTIPNYEELLLNKIKEDTIVYFLINEKQHLRTLKIKKLKRLQFEKTGGTYLYD